MVAPDRPSLMLGLPDAGAAMPKIAAHGIAVRETEPATTIIEK